MKKIKLFGFALNALLMLNMGCSDSENKGTTEPVVEVPEAKPSIVGTTYYVDASKSISGDGKTEATAFKDLPEAALATSAPGDIVLVKNGTYSAFTETTSGAENGYVVWKNFPGHNPVISFNGWFGISIKGNYIEINGITIRGNNANCTLAEALNQGKSCQNPSGALDAKFNGNGISVDGRVSPSSNPAGIKYHHLTVKNCTIYECGGGGIATVEADYTTIEGCRIYNNAWYSIYGQSGISFLQHVNTDSNTGIKNTIRNNIVYGNEMRVPWAGGGCVFYDGNGIILDNLKTSVGGAYTGKTLIENNVVFNNGGRGIHCYISDNMICVNNTCYNNCAASQISDGEITVMGQAGKESSNCIVYNNIMYARTGEKVNTVSNVKNYRQFKNIYFNSTSGYDLSTNDKLGDPRFVNAAGMDFTLLPDSPAINYGNKTEYYPAKDINGTVRYKGSTVDAGAYEMN